MSVKKKTRERRMAEVEAAASATTQSAAARRLAEGELKLLIASFASEHTRLIAALRRSLRKRLPTAHEIVYEYRDFFVISFAPNEHGYEGVLGIRAHANGVKLFFNYSQKLPDPAKLLRGSGSQVRSIDIEGATTLKRPEVASLIDAAIAQNPVPFENAGRGSIVIRSTTARKRRET